jgi:Na+/H+-dicarboxylate symporter
MRDALAMFVRFDAGRPARVAPSVTVAVAIPGMGGTSDHMHAGRVARPTLIAVTALSFIALAIGLAIAMSLTGG